MKSNTDIETEIRTGIDALRVDGKIRFTTLNAFLWNVMLNVLRSGEPEGIIVQHLQCCARVHDDVRSKEG